MESGSSPCYQRVATLGCMMCIRGVKRGEMQGCVLQEQLMLVFGSCSKLSVMQSINHIGPPVATGLPVTPIPMSTIVIP